MMVGALLMAKRSKRFWEEEAPEALLEALAAKALPKYDAIIVDEAQDFRSDWTSDQITILTPHRRDNLSLKGATELGGVPLADEPGARAGKVLYTTIGAFKGLESDVVILVDIDPSDTRSDRRARYVAASRAKLALHVYAKGDWLAAQ